MKPTKYSILPQSNTRARVRIASCLWLGILNCLALVIWHQSAEPKALSDSISGPAWIRDIEPCQGVLPGDGQVITAMFQHSSGDVIDLVWSDDGSRNLESIGTTSNHPFYSIDRGDYVQAGSLQEGERLLTYSGDTKRVVSKLARPGPETVYNLEVFGEHVYFIGHDGVLVHNSDSYGLNAAAPIKVPHGFVTAEEFTNFGTALGNRFKGAGYDDIQAVLQGSAVTGVRATSKPRLGIPAGTPFDAMKVSDFDVALVSPKLLAKAKELGIPPRGTAKMRTGELWPGNLHALGVGDIKELLGKTIYYHDGRKINFMIFGSMEEALKRGPSIRIPGT